MWTQYERWKRLLRELNLSPEEYERLIKLYWSKQDERKTMGKGFKDVTY